MTDEVARPSIAQPPSTVPNEFSGPPQKTRAEVNALERTDDVADFADAIKHTTPADIELKSPSVGKPEPGVTVRAPIWPHTDSATRLYEFETCWVYSEGPVRLDALHVVALEEGLIDSVDDYPTGTTYHTALNALRDRGAAIPDYDWTLPEHVPVLPSEESLREHGSTSSPEGRRTEPSASGGRKRDYQKRCQETIERVIRRGSETLVTALPSMGKSCGTVHATRETGEPVTILTCRGQEEQYDQYEEWAAENDLQVRQLPNFFDVCPTAASENPTTEIQERVLDLYSRGAGGMEIHERAKAIFGAPLPCQQGGECPYEGAWSFERDEFDIHLGHYTHAYNPLAIEDRTVILDEFPGDAYERKLGSNRQTAITHFLQASDELPFEDYTDLVEHRNDSDRCEWALERFDEAADGYADAIFESDNAYASAPLAVYTLLTARDLGNGWEYAWPVGTGDRAFDRTGLYHRESGAIFILESPDFSPPENVIALDGTPTPEMWELSLSVELEEEQVLSESERRTYLRGVLDHEYIRTTEYMKPYNSTVRNLEQDTALLEAISDRHNTEIGLITTNTAEDRYREAGVLGLVDDVEHYGNLLGSNTFEERRVGVVVGANHFGDDFVEKWSAYACHAAEREGKGSDLSYGEFGDKVQRHMLDHETLQAVMRFGRDGGGATVYVHTNTLPEWVPVANDARIIKAWSSGAKQVIEVAADLESWRTSDLAQHPNIHVGKRQIRNILHDLADRGCVEVSREGRGYRWENAGLTKIAEESIDLTSVPEMETSSIYKWDFRNSSQGRRDR